jgi:hypothetical protein
LEENEVSPSEEIIEDTKVVTEDSRPEEPEILNDTPEVKEDDAQHEEIIEASEQPAEDVIENS